MSSLLRLSLFQVSVGIATVLLVGTLNRVMIVELGAGFIGSYHGSYPYIIGSFESRFGV